MSYKLFKNAKAARKYLPNVFINIKAVDENLKPCYLWDAFEADCSEVQLYLKELLELGLIVKNLLVFIVNDTLFVTQYENLKNCFDHFDEKNVNIVDVSKTEVLPSILPYEVKIKILNTIIDNVRNILSKCINSQYEADQIISNCNITTLFGALLGYPVLYWYNTQNNGSDYSCLSMTPLKVCSVVSAIKAHVNPYKNNISANHEIYSFSVPENLSNLTKQKVDDWFKKLSNYRTSTFCNLQMVQNTVTLPYVVM